MSRALGTATIAILAALKRRVRYGLDITQQTGLMPGTVYTTLRRLEERQFVEGQWEDPAAAEAERRPRRRYYTLTPLGAAALDDASERLARLARSVRRPVPGASGR